MITPHQMRLVRVLVQAYDVFAQCITFQWSNYQACVYMLLYQLPIKPTDLIILALGIVTATILILERERTHPQVVSSSCFIVDSHSTETFGSALPFRSHINSPGILRPAVATFQDDQLYA